MTKRKRNLIFVLSALLFVVSILASCGTELQEQSMEERSDSNDGSEESVPLNPYENENSMSLEEALRQRKSTRQFADLPVEMEKIGKLLMAVQGESADVVSGATRPVASAGATHPLEIYVVAGEVEDLEAGVYQYEPATEALIQVAEGDIRDSLAQAALGQNVIADAPATIVVAAEKHRTTQRYGERGIRYVYMESGGAAQHISLQAASLGLGSVIIGAFEDEKVSLLLEIPEAPLLLIPVGY